jgi:hypothetical protein
MMASVAVIFGGLSGFLSTLFALLALDAGWLLALGLWPVIGSAITLCLIALATSARHPQRELWAEHA